MQAKVRAMIKECGLALTTGAIDTLTDWLDVKLTPEDVSGKHVIRTEAIAGAGITRFYAANLSVRRATRKMYDNELDLVRDYVGGTGCGDH